MARSLSGVEGPLTSGLRLRSATGCGVPSLTETNGKVPERSRRVVPERSRRAVDVRASAPLSHRVCIAEGWSLSGAEGPLRSKRTNHPFKLLHSPASPTDCMSSGLTHARFLGLNECLDCCEIRLNYDSKELKLFVCPTLRKFS